MRRSGNHNEEEGETVENPRTAWQSLDVEEYGPYYINCYTQFFMTSQPLDYFDDLVEYLHKQGIAYRISGSTLRLKFETSVNPPAQAEESKEAPPATNFKVDIQVLKVNENKSCVKFTYKDPVTKREIGPQSAAAI